MTPAELLAWQDRLFGGGYGSQTDAAAALGVPPQTYRNWITGRSAVPASAARLCRYIERFGVIEFDDDD